jgi:hypothetical protein
MQVMTCYTDSHIQLLERHYLPSLPTGCEVHLIHLPQECPTGQYRSAGWVETVGKRLRAVEDMCERGERFAVFDADMRFYSDAIVDGWPGPEDIIAQDEGPAGLCAGLMFIRPVGAWDCTAATLRDAGPPCELGTWCRAQACHAG